MTMTIDALLYTMKLAWDDLSVIAVTLNPHLDNNMPLCLCTYHQQLITYLLQ
jgi:hypothetical protein